jgi:hypothetical protein
MTITSKNIRRASIEIRLVHDPVNANRARAGYGPPDGPGGQVRCLTSDLIDLGQHGIHVRTADYWTSREGWPCIMFLTA